MPVMHSPSQRQRFQLEGAEGGRSGKEGERTKLSSHGVSDDLHASLRWKQMETIPPNNNNNMNAMTKDSDDEDEELGAFIYRTSRTAKSIQEAANKAAAEIIPTSTSTKRNRIQTARYETDARSLRHDDDANAYSIDDECIEITSKAEEEHDDTDKRSSTTFIPTGGIDWHKRRNISVEITTTEPKIICIKEGCTNLCVSFRPGTCRKHSEGLPRVKNAPPTPKCTYAGCTKNIVYGFPGKRFCYKHHSLTCRVSGCSNFAWYVFYYL